MNSLAKRMTTSTVRCICSLAWLASITLTHPQTLAFANDGTQREPWTASRIIGSPDPALPYVAKRAFPELKFDMCVDLVMVPGSDRFFLVEQWGKIYSFPDDQAATEADLVIDIAKELPGVKETYSLAFHPDFERNRYCYICYIEEHGKPDGTHVARFTVNDSTPPTIDASSEVTLLTWWSGGHNGCHLLFGPDGYLYITAGDANAANPPDIFKTGQDLSDIPASILRIDVDHSDADRNYRIPADNPFVELPGVRPEIWAYGLRNPWRMSFDRMTGDLWCGDVGWELWEMLHRIEGSGNYGWSIMEGPQPINTDLPLGPSPILPPIVQHSHTESSSITDGLSYYGAQFKDLHGTHIYADYDTGKFWGIRYVDGKVVDQRTLADTSHRVVSFAEDRRGEFYFLDHTAGTIHSLEDNPMVDRKSDFPLALSQSGLFASLVEQTPERGVVSYAINAEPWADHATIQRWVAIPDSHAIDSSSGTWSFPVNSVLVKTLSLEMRAGDATSRRPIETQLLHFDGQDWLPYTYRWNDEQTDALLVDAAGDERQLEIEDLHAPGGKRLQHWQFAGRAECQRCHNKYAGTVLGFTPPQLNNRSDGAQLDHFAAIQLISNALSVEQTPKLANPHDLSASLNDRARAYLHVNCGHCHRMSAGGSVPSYMHFDLSLEQTNLLIKPTQGDFGISDALVVAPGAPYRSVLPYRLAKLGGGRMPRLCSNEVDANGLALVCNWIAELPTELTPNGASADSSQDQSISQRLQALALSKAEAEQRGTIDHLLRSTSGALALLHAVDEQRLPAETMQLATSLGSGHANDAVRELFERFLPANERVARLGSVIQPEVILKLGGDAERGRKLFLNNPSVSCKNCHRLEEQGVAVGPDLSDIARKLNATQLLESILEPSKVIDPKFQSYLVATADGQIRTGILISRNEQGIVLKNAANEELAIATEEIEQIVPQGVSLMPELLVREMTAQQVADLIAYLSTLKSSTP